ncbi:hypothetical protein J2X63_002181 [Agromyces sp. 3263]|uniref:hypothetical protein n=1 Tax=Agromyces sp. 3263 TaxID=2817750 RepID=UPI0028608C73|nr:hypothetical protein [Agromyces sp. 3263]MDR6906495.1 hypothetical protein [Agromyces sp. 3263]
MPESPAPLRVRLRAGALAAIAGVTLLAVTGCTGAPVPTAAPASSAAADPIFATDEEALAAAEAAYERFLEVSTAVTSDGGSDPERLETVATGAALAEEIDAASEFQAEGLRTTGSIRFRVNDLQSNDVAEGLAQVTVYVCDDLRDLDVLDASGSSMVVDGRVVDVPYTVVLEGDATSLLVSKRELWARDNFCLG